MRKHTIRRIDYKDPATLSKFLTKWGKIKPASYTRLSASQQRRLAEAIKRARFLGLMPYTKR